MADNGRWFKLWCCSISDPSLDNLSIENFGRWAKLGAYIKEHGTDGELILTEPSRKVVSMMQLSTFQDVILCVQNFPNVTVSPVTNTSVSYLIKYENWYKYQGDYSYNRVKKFRAKSEENETIKKRREEKRREEIRKEEKEYKEKDFILPSFLDIKIWNDYLEMRTKIRKPATKKAKELIILKLQKLKEQGNNPNKVLEQSIENSWQGVFELKNKTKENIGVVL